MARKHWPNEDALGKRIYFGDGKSDPRFRIIGIVGDVKIDLDDRERPTMYLPLLEGGRSTFYAVIHTAGDPAARVPAVRREVSALDPDLPLYKVRLMDEVLENSAAHRRFTALIVAVFACIALALAAIGLYGVLSYVVSQRTGEIGIRMVLGASSGDVHRLVLLQGTRPVVAGVAFGIVGALAATRLFRTLLFGVGPHDPVTFIAVTGLLLLVALTACYVPAYRDPEMAPVSG